MRGVLTIKQAAALAGFHPHTLVNAINSGTLEAFRDGRAWLIRRHKLESWKAARPISQSDKIKEGLKAARVNDKRLGRPPIFVNVPVALKYRSDGLSWRQIGREMGISARTLRRAVNNPNFAGVQLSEMEKRRKERKWLRMARVRLREVNRLLKSRDAR